MRKKLKLLSQEGHGPKIQKAELLGLTHIAEQNS